MMNATITQIKHLENILEVLDKFGIEIGLDNILVEELPQGLPNDLGNYL